MKFTINAIHPTEGKCENNGQRLDPQIYSVTVQALTAQLAVTSQIHRAPNCRLCGVSYIPYVLSAQLAPERERNG